MHALITEEERIISMAILDVHRVDSDVAASKDIAAV
jgi:hypothetical protein